MCQPLKSSGDLLLLMVLCHLCYLSTPTPRFVEFRVWFEVSILQSSFGDYLDFCTPTQDAAIVGNQQLKKGHLVVYGTSGDDEILPSYVGIIS